MRQLLQNLKTGETQLLDVPVPEAGPGHVVISTRRSLVSAGTERMLVDFGKSGWLGKAIQQPERVRQVLEKVRSDGVLAAVTAVRSKLDQAIPLGYSNAGIVVEVGRQVTGLKRGDRVASNAKHAEYVSAPMNLCARIPDVVSDDEAAFTVLGAIALQGIRLTQPTLGERFAVIGLGLIGLLTVQILRAHGCRVLAIDMQADRLQAAAQFGAETFDLRQADDPVQAGMSFSQGRGLDGVIIAAATSSNDPIQQAARMSRKRGRIVLVGVTGLQLSRTDFYEKELTFQVSCSYGPGRYDRAYEEQGRDYPIGYVRWTEQRNFEAVLDLMAQGKLDVTSLITHRFPFGDAAQAYQLISSEQPHLGVLFDYPAQSVDAALHRTLRLSGSGAPPAAAVVGVIGAGNYASAVLLPALGRTGVRCKMLASTTGISGSHQGRKHRFEVVTSDSQVVFDDPEINAVLIATRHESHAALAQRAVACGKHVFIEKPLAIRDDELKLLLQAYEKANPRPVLMVGFNRRFAPQALKMRELLRGIPEQKVVVITINAGAIPSSHWTQDPETGGGRIIGEGCHFIDLARFLVGMPIVRLEAVALGNREELAYTDKASITLKFEDGSFAAIHYLANGHRSFPKERVEVFCAGRILQLDNFRRLKAYGWPRFSGSHLWRQDKGNAACVAAFVRAVERGGEAPIPVHELFEVSEATLRASELLRC